MLLVLCDQEPCGFLPEKKEQGVKKQTKDKKRHISSPFFKIFVTPCKIVEIWFCYTLRFWLLLAGLIGYRQVWLV